MPDNPFKFGSIVNDPYFINRKDEIIKVKNVLKSSNHLILISPRRFGKSSLIFKVIGQLNRPVISLDMQLITSLEDFSAQLLKRVYRIFPFEKIKQYIRNFQIIPSVAINPVTSEVDISFQPGMSTLPMIEDVLNLIEKLSNQKKKIIVALDEFQEIIRIEKGFDSKLRSVIQHHQNVNYIFLGSQESLIKEIFEKKKSPFYHFGLLMPLGKIPCEEFLDYVEKGLRLVTNDHKELSEEITRFTGCHPYYTQQLAYLVWDLKSRKRGVSSPVDQAIDEMVQNHDIDYERLWNSLNTTDKKILIGLSLSQLPPLSEAFNQKYRIGASSTTYSSLKKLMVSGFIIRNEKTYEIDDPFFSYWLKKRRDF